MHARLPVPDTSRISLLCCLSTGMPRSLLWLFVIIEILVIAIVAKYLLDSEISGNTRSGVVRGEAGPQSRNAGTGTTQAQRPSHGLGQSSPSLTTTTTSRQSATRPPTTTTPRQSNRVRERSAEDGHGVQSSETCGICMESITDRCVLNACMHAFDRECILTWFRTSRRGQGYTCPACRQRVHAMFMDIRPEGDAQVTRLGARIRL